MSRDRQHISAVGDETIVIDDLVGLALLDGTAPPWTIRWANAAFASTLARGLVDVAGQSLAEIVDVPDLQDALARIADGGERTVRLPVGQGAVVLQLSPTAPDGPVVVAARQVHSTPRSAMFDAVTGLASLDLFREHLQLGLNRRAREGDDLAVVTVSAEGFGDAWERSESGPLLQARMAERIEEVVRDADVLAARRPGAFVLLVIDPTDAVAAATVASERLLAAFETPLVLSGRLQPLNLHIGIAAAQPDDSPDDTLARADAALARAVQAGANLYRVELG